MKKKIMLILIGRTNYFEAYKRNDQVLILCFINLRLQVKSR